VHTCTDTGGQPPTSSSRQPYVASVPTVGGGGRLRRVDAGKAAAPAAADMLAIVPECTGTTQTWYSAIVSFFGHTEARARTVVSVALPRALKKGVSPIGSTALGPVAVAPFGGATSISV